MKMDSLERALLQLASPEYEGIQCVFGTVLRKRATALVPDCGWFDILSKNSGGLHEAEKFCRRYVLLVGESDASHKCEADLLGPAANDRTEFEGHLQDFFAEIAAVTELSKCGYSDFRSLPVPGPDYEAKKDGQRVCIEVKHLRSPISVADVFMAEIYHHAEANPECYPYTLSFRYPNDNTIDAEREKQIREVVMTLGNRTAPFKQEFMFSDKTILEVSGEPGDFMVRRNGSKTLADPPRFKVEAVLKKVREKASKTAEQMRGASCLKILVLNVNSIWAEIEIAHVRVFADIIRSAGLQPYILHHYHLLSQDLYAA